MPNSRLVRNRFLLGDSDPPDLLVFAWPRQRMQITYLGITDKLLSHCGVPMSDELCIELSNSEMAALPLVSECVAEWPTQLGTWCSELLKSGQKMELEALFNFTTRTPSELKAILIS